jgi:uncharacterized protein (DUF2062 family)
MTPLDLTIGATLSGAITACTAYLFWRAGISRGVKRGLALRNKADTFAGAALRHRYCRPSHHGLN